MGKKIFGLALIAALIGIMAANIIQDTEEKNEIQAAQEDFNAKEEEKLEEGLKEGDMPPDFELQTLDGGTMRLSALKGKKVVLNFWATWCPPCKAEMPHMQHYYETKAKGQNAEIIAVNLTYAEHGGDRRPKVENFKKEYKLTFPILLDEQGEIGAMYRAVTIPTTYLMDTEGIIRKKMIGPLDEERLERLVNGMD